MANTIRIKRTITSGAIPTTSTIQPAELAMNLTDGRLYSRDNNNTIMLISDRDSLYNNHEPIHFLI